MLECFSFYPVLVRAFSSVLAGLLTSQVDYRTEMENNGNFNPYVREQKMSCQVVSIQCFSKHPWKEIALTVFTFVLALIPCMTQIGFAKLEAYYF